MEKIKQLAIAFKLRLDLIFFYIISASLFIKLPNKKVTKTEVFYIWMSIAGGLGAYGVARDHINDVEFSTQALVLLIMFLVGGVMRVGTAFGYKASRAVRDYFWETQLMRFLDPKYLKYFEAYPNGEERLKELQLKWIDKYNVTVEWTRANAPTWQKIQIALLVGVTALGLVLGLVL